MSPEHVLHTANLAELRAKSRKRRAGTAIERAYWHMVAEFHGWRGQRAYRQWRTGAENFLSARKPATPWPKWL